MPQTINQADQLPDRDSCCPTRTTMPTGMSGRKSGAETAASWAVRSSTPASPPASSCWRSWGVATWEREIMLERQREGIARAKAAGEYKGRPISIDAVQIRQLRAELGPAAIAKKLGIARSSVYRVLGA